MGARVSSAWLPLAGDAGSLRPRSRRPAALRLENEFEQRSRADLTCRSRQRDVKRARSDPEKMKNIGEISIDGLIGFVPPFCPE